MVTEVIGKQYEINTVVWKESFWKQWMKLIWALVEPGESVLAVEKEVIRRGEVYFYDFTGVIEVIYETLRHFSSFRDVSTR